VVDRSMKRDLLHWREGVRLLQVRRGSHSSSEKDTVHLIVEQVDDRDDISLKVKAGDPELGIDIVETIGTIYPMKAV
jgi:hypothetical protein